MTTLLYHRPEKLNKIAVPRVKELPSILSAVAGAEPSSIAASSVNVQIGLNTKKSVLTLKSNRGYRIFAVVSSKFLFFFPYEYLLLFHLYSFFSCLFSVQLSINDRLTNATEITETFGSS